MSVIIPLAAEMAHQGLERSRRSTRTRSRNPVTSRTAGRKTASSRYSFLEL
jgi:hypothetical protein